MDEPSLGLAPVVVDEVFDVIEAVRGEGVGVLLVEQNVQRALDVSSRAYLLAEGRVVMEGDAAGMAEPGLRKSVLRDLMRRPSGTHLNPVISGLAGVVQW